jgi:LL-diaminopimelate aminotransferase
MRMDTGEPDDMVASSAIEALCCEVKKCDSRGHADGGRVEFREAASEYMRSKFGVSMNTQTEIVHSAGIKSALAFYAAYWVSIFNASGAMDVAIEFHSMSNGFAMTGWRIGWICGNEKLIEACSYVGERTNAGQFLAMQKASAQMLGNLFIAENNASKCCDRMGKIAQILKDCGFAIAPAKAGFFIYAGIPCATECTGRMVNFSSSEQFSLWMVDAFGIVTITWDEVEPLVRFSAAFGHRDMEDWEIIDLFVVRMANVRFKFYKN